MSSAAALLRSLTVACALGLVALAGSATAVRATAASAVAAPATADSRAGNSAPANSDANPPGPPAPGPANAAPSDSGQPAPTAAIRTLLFFGDSITAGYGLENPDSDAYPSVIREKIARAGLPWKVVNAGLSGETSAGGLRRIDWILRQRIDLFVLALGGNDGLRGLSPADMRSNLAEIIARVRRAKPAAEIVVAGIQMPTTMGADYVQAFDAAFGEVARECHARLIPELLAGVGGHSELNQADRIHPNPEGARIVADNVWAVVGPLLSAGPSRPQSASAATAP